MRVHAAFGNSSRFSAAKRYLGTVSAELGSAPGRQFQKSTTTGKNTQRNRSNLYREKQPADRRLLFP